MHIIQDIQIRLRSFLEVHPLFVQLIFGASLASFAFVVVLWLGEDILENEVISFDAGIAHFILNYRTSGLTQVMLAITSIGSATSLFLLSVATVMYLYKKIQKEAILFSLIFFSAAILNLLLKIFFARPRPTLMPIIYETSYSFPSGHAMNSFVFFTMLSYFVYRNTKNISLTVSISAVCAVVVLLIGLSRIYLGAHYPSDVIAGYLTGLLWCTIIIMIEKYIHARRSLQV